MEKAIILANDLVREVLTSDCYMDYIKACENVKRSPELLNRINDFKEHHLDFQTKKLREGYDSFEEEKFVSKLFSDLLLNQETRDFLEKERDYLTLINNIFAVISKISTDF